MRATCRKNNQAILKYYAWFTDCITEINNTKVDNGKDLDAIIPIYHLIEYRDNHSKISRGLCQIII